MRRFAAVALLALGCAGENDAEFLAHEGTVADDSGMDIKTIANAAAITVACTGCADGCGCNETTTPTPAADLCFSVDQEVTELLPSAPERLTEAAAAWGRTLRVSDDCESVLRLSDEPSLTGKNALAVHRPLVKVNDEWTPAGKGGASELVLSRPAILDGRVQDISADECNAAWDSGANPSVLLQLILVHEVGHLWGLGESESQDDAMFFARRVCTELTPTSAERALTGR